MNPLYRMSAGKIFLRPVRLRTGQAPTYKTWKFMRYFVLEEARWIVYDKDYRAPGKELS